MKTVEIAGETLTLDPAGALWWEAERTLVVSDLHLEKGSSYARRGSFLPPYDTAATLRRVTQLVDGYRPGRVISLGDSFHDRDAVSRLSGEATETLLRLATGREWIWISGNHDAETASCLGGECASEFKLRTLTFRHEPLEGAAAGEIAGHLHPAARLRLRGRGLRRRCFATDGNRLVMPAFGAYTGGLNVLDEAWESLFSVGSFCAWVIGGRGVYGFPARHLLPDGA